MVTMNFYKFCFFLGTQTGAIYQVGPIRDKMFSRLRITEKNLIQYLGPVCGVAPKIRWLVVCFFIIN